MIIRGFFRGDTAFINTRLVSKSLGIDKRIELLIDTGASKTVLLDRDALFLKLNFHALKKFGTNLSGIGGSVDTFVIEDASLIFKSEDRQIVLKTHVFVLRHELENISYEERAKILRIPSVLGRDVINRYKLVFHKKNDTVFLTNESP